MAKEYVKIKRSKDTGFVDVEVYNDNNELIGIHTSPKADSLPNVRQEVDRRHKLSDRAAEKARLEAILAGL